MNRREAIVSAIGSALGLSAGCLVESPSIASDVCQPIKGLSPRDITPRVVKVAHDWDGKSFDVVTDITVDDDGIISVHCITISVHDCL